MKASELVARLIAAMQELFSRMRVDLQQILPVSRPVVLERVGERCFLALNGLSQGQLDEVAEGLHAIQSLVAPPVPPEGPPHGPVIEIPYGWTLEQAEREIVLRTIESFNGNVSAAARTLGVARRTIYYWLRGTLPLGPRRRKPSALKVRKTGHA